MDPTQPDVKGLRGFKIALWLTFHIFTLGFFLIPHALLHFIFRDK